MGLLTFALNVTLDGCCDHREGIANDEMLRYWTRVMDGAGAMLFGRRTYELMEDAWPRVARDPKATPSNRNWAKKLEAKPKYVVSTTRLRTAMGKRSEGLGIVISTQAANRIPRRNSAENSSDNTTLDGQNKTGWTAVSGCHNRCPSVVRAISTWSVADNRANRPDARDIPVQAMSKID
jgi:hypothetical protein